MDQKPSKPVVPGSFSTPRARVAKYRMSRCSPITGSTRSRVSASGNRVSWRGMGVDCSRTAYRRKPEDTRETFGERAQSSYLLACEIHFRNAPRGHAGVAQFAVHRPHVVARDGER